METSQPESPEAYRERMRALTPEERFNIACRLTAEARARVIASLPKVLSKFEFKRQFFQRCYGYPLPAVFAAQMEEAHRREANL